MCGIIGIVGREDVAERLLDGLKRLEYRGYDSAGIATLDGRPDRAPPGRGQARQSRQGPARQPARRHHRHRPYPLGDAWRADRGQCPSAYRRRCLHRPQRHHREFQAAARRADRRRAQLQQPDRHRGRRPSGRARAGAGQEPARRGRRGAAAPARRLRARLPVPHRSGPADRRPARGAAHRRLWRGRELYRLGRDRAGAAHPAHRLSRGRRLGRGEPRRGSRFTTATTGRSSARSSTAAPPAS